MKRRGFTIIEILMVLAVMGVLSSLGALRYIDFTNEAQSAAVASQMHSIRLAAYNFYADRGVWPPETAAGAVPAGLEAYLPRGTSFTAPKYQLDWENLGGAEGDATIAITIANADPKLLNKLAQRLGAGGRPYVLVNGLLTYIIVDPSGVF